MICFIIADGPFYLHVINIQEETHMDMHQNIFSPRSSFHLHNMKVPTDVVCHPKVRAKQVIIQLPGQNGTLNGFNDKYVKIADHLSNRLDAAIVRANNKFELNSESGEETLRARVERLVEFTTENWSKLTGTRTEPNISVIGFSAGASGLAANISENYQSTVQNMLLIAPGQMGGFEKTVEGIRSFKGKLSIAFPENDTIIPPEVTLAYKEALESRLQNDTLRSNTKTCIIPDCNHEFHGEKNGYYLSALGIWAQTDQINPMPQLSGIKLYEDIS